MTTHRSDFHLLPLSDQDFFTQCRLMDEILFVQHVGDVHFRMHNINFTSSPKKTVSKGCCSGVRNGFSSGISGILQLMKTAECLRKMSEANRRAEERKGRVVIHCGEGDMRYIFKSQSMRGNERLCSDWSGSMISAHDDFETHSQMYTMCSIPGVR